MGWSLKNEDQPIRAVKASYGIIEQNETRNHQSWKIQNFRPLDLKKKMRPGESVIQSLLFISGVLSIFITVAIVYELGKEAMLFFNNPDVTLAKFFGTTQWQPGIGLFGIWPLVTCDSDHERHCDIRLASSWTGSCSVSK